MATKPQPIAAPPAAHGIHTTHGLPHGYTSLTPHVVVRPASEALDFYREVFGADVLDVTRSGDLIAHAVLRLQSGCFTLSDPMHSYGLVAPSSEATSMSLSLYVPNADVVVEAAVARGARVREPLSNFVSGDRFASILDPFGVRWAIMTRIEDLSFEESARRVAEWAAQLG